MSKCILIEHFEHPKNQIQGFFDSIDEKGTDLQLIKEKFKEFDRIKLVTRRKHLESGKINYDFYYLLKNNYYIIYAIDLDGEKPILINALYVERNFKRYKDWLVRAYGNKLIG
jgi:hypothetical protein